MDVKAAFDNVYQLQLLNTLKEVDLPPQLRRGMESFLSNRTASNDFDHHVEEMSPIRTRIGQGFPELPVLSLLNPMPQFDVLERKYPDPSCPSNREEVGMLVIGKTEVSSSIRLERIAEPCTHWGAVNAPLFDNLNRELTQDHGKRESNQPAVTEVKMPDGYIIAVKEVKRALLVRFDCKMNFKNPVSRKPASSLGAFNATGGFASAEKGVTDQALRKLFQAYVATNSDFGPYMGWNSRVGLRNIIP